MACRDALVRWNSAKQLRISRTGKAIYDVLPNAGCAESVAGLTALWDPVELIPALALPIHQVRMRVAGNALVLVWTGAGGAASVAGELNALASKVREPLITRADRWRWSVEARVEWAGQAIDWILSYTCLTLDMAV